MPRAESESQTFMVGAQGPDEYKLIFDGPNVDVPVASSGVSSLFSRRFVMVVSTQLVFAVCVQKTIVSAWEVKEWKEQSGSTQQQGGRDAGSKSKRALKQCHTQVLYNDIQWDMWQHVLHLLGHLRNPMIICPQTLDKTKSNGARSDT